MMSPEQYYQNYIANKDPKDAKKQIKDLKKEIKTLQTYVDKNKVCLEKPDYKTQLSCYKQYLEYINSQLEGNDVIKYTWHNFGMMKSSSLAKFEILVSAKEIAVKFYNGEKSEFELSTTQVSSIYGKTASSEIVNKCNKIDLPEQTNYKEEHGCDGFAWELEIKNKKYEGYLIEPAFIKSIKTLLKVKDVHAIAKMTCENK